MRNFYEWLVTLIGAIYFVLSGLLLSLLSLFVRPFLNEQQANKLGRYSMHYISRLFFAGLRLSGLVTTNFSELDKLRHERGIIITPNHPGLMDALYISSRLPNVVCVMKASVIKNPILFGAAWLGGFIQSDSATQLTKQCQHSLEAGAQLLLFPEGTRTIHRPINPFKGGFALIARNSAAPIQTVFIKTSNQFLGKHWKLLQKPDFPLNYQVQLGERFSVDKNQNHRNFTRDLEHYFTQQLTK